MRSVPGVGPQRALTLRKLGFETVEDLLHHLPLRYEDRCRLIPLAKIEVGSRASFLAAVRSPKLIRTRRRGFTIVQALLDDGSAAVPAVWFNQPYLARVLLEGRTAYFYGELRVPRSQPSALRFENPQFELVDGDEAQPIHAGRIVPVYEKIGSLSGKAIRSLIHRILASEGGSHTIGGRGAKAGGWDRSEPPETTSGTEARTGATELVQARGAPGEFLPEEIRRRHGLPGRQEALSRVHFPPPWEHLERKGGSAPGKPVAAAHRPIADTGREPPPPLASDAAAGREPGESGEHPASPDAYLEALNRFGTPHHRRLVFDEFVLLQIGLAMRRAARREEARGFTYRTSPAIREKLARILPFRLTQDQRKVLREIVEDLCSPHPMNRLLQGDVGSGKTIVAILAMALAAENGLQSALMAPTEILAEQHARSLEECLQPAGYRVVLLTSAIKGRERAERLAALESGDAQMAVGTHALVEKGVVFSKLGLVVVDEQHRFGVVHRSRLCEKGSAPDTLVMTATPIPRTLALTVYGDLDHSVIEKLPPGRTKVLTLVRGETDRPRLYEWMRAELAKGRQAFVVYPLVDEKRGSDLRAARAMARRLGQDVFPGSAVGLVHGRMNPKEKETAMAAFRASKVSVLVATTVVEVGIDVPNATILVVEHAERFGLSQLHQLRGRVGRGALRSTCVLMAGEDLTEAARARLAAIECESSGFRLAEIDLEIRGPGEFFGTRQSGLPDLRVGNLVRDRDLMDAARREAFSLVNDGTDRGRARLESVVSRLRPAWRDRFRLAGVG